MSLHIQRFIDLIKATESRGQRDLHMTLRDAKDLHTDITKLLLSIEHLRQQIANQTDSADQVIRLEIEGGSFKST